MVPTDGVAIDAVTTRRTHWRGALFGVCLAVGVGLLILFAPQSARADDGHGLVGTVSDAVGGVAATAQSVTAPVVDPLPDLRELPVVGGLIGDVADSRPVASVTQPVAGLVDGLLGSPVVAPVTAPVADLVDDAVGGLAGGAAGAEPSPESAVPPIIPAASAADAASDSMMSAALRLVPAVAAAGQVAATVADDDIRPLFVGANARGASDAATAASSGGAPTGLAVAVLGVGLLLLLARGRLRPESARAPGSPVFDTDTSPD